MPGRQHIMNYGGGGNQCLWHNLRNHADICLVGLKETVKRNSEQPRFEPGT